MITASIVAYHTPEDELTRLLQCVIRSSIEVLYLIDHSSDDSLGRLASLSDKIVYIHSENLGYGHGHNIGICKALK